MSLTKKELKEISIAVIISAIVFSFNEWGITTFSFSTGLTNLTRALLLSSIVIFFHIYMQKTLAKKFDTNIEYSLFKIEKLSKIKPKKFLLPIGPIITLLTTLVSNGKLMLLLLNTFELKENKTKRVGRKWTNLKEFEIAQIALIGVLADILLLMLFKFLTPLAPLFFKKAIFIASSFAVFHILPIPKIDGLKIFFGSKFLYFFSVVFVLSIIPLVYLLNPFIALIFALILSAFLEFIYFYKSKS